MVWSDENEIDVPNGIVDSEALMDLATFRTFMKGKLNVEFSRN